MQLVVGAAPVATDRRQRGARVALGEDDPGEWLAPARQIDQQLALKPLGPGGAQHRPGDRLGEMAHLGAGGSELGSHGRTVSPDGRPGLAMSHNRD